MLTQNLKLCQQYQQQPEMAITARGFPPRFGINYKFRRSSVEKRKFYFQSLTHRPWKAISKRNLPFQRLGRTQYSATLDNGHASTAAIAFNTAKQYSHITCPPSTMSHHVYALSTLLSCINTAVLSPQDTTRI